MRAICQMHQATECSPFGGMRRTWLRGRDNLQKRNLIHISGYNLGLIMRLLTGFGTPRRWANAQIAMIWLRYPIDGETDAVLGCLLVINGQYQGKIIATELTLFTRCPTISATRC